MQKVKGTAVWIGTGCLVFLFAAMVLAPAVAQDSGDAEIRERKEEFLYILGPGDWGRLNLSLQADGGINYVLESGNRPVEFHLYSEANGTILDHIGPKRVRSDSGTFVAPSDGTYVIYTERQMELEATVRLILEGEFGILDREGMDPAQEVPGPGMAPLIVGTLCVLGRLRRSRAGR